MFMHNLKQARPLICRMEHKIVVVICKAQSKKSLTGNCNVTLLSYALK